MSEGPLIIGCGNPDRGDDAAGLLVVRRLRELGIEAQEQGGDALALIETWRGAEKVVLIDTVVTGSRRGKVTVWDADARPLVGDCFHYSTHAFGVAGAVELSRTLGWLPSRLRIYGIEGKQFEMGTRPSPAVLHGVEQVARQIAQQATAFFFRLTDRPTKRRACSADLSFRSAAGVSILHFSASFSSPIADKMVGV